MKELGEILAAVRRADAAGEQAALATIISVRGSTYRREGARLLTTSSGRQTGNISGGCLEGDLAVVSSEVLAAGVPRAVTYDLTADDDAVWGLGLGCNGAIEVFVEPASAGDLLWRAVEATLEHEATVSVATVVGGSGDVQAGRRVLVWPGGRRDGSLGDPRSDAEVEAMAQAALSDLRPRTGAVQEAGGPLRVFVEVLHPPPRLVVCGAGHDAIPVVRLASLLGWRVLVVDRREAFLTAERFPGATGFVHTAFERAGQAVPTDVHTYVLIMTHNYVHDRDLLRSFLPTAAAYLGMLGPRARTEKIMLELEAEGVVIEERRRAQIFGPVGLDIGGETPDEIALAALSEILAAARGRGGGFLRDRAGPIHGPRRGAPAPPGGTAGSDGTSGI